MKKLLFSGLTLALLFILCISGCQKADTNQPIFNEDIKHNDWVECVNQISKIEGVEPEKIMLRELTIGWNDNMLDDLHMLIRISGTTKGYSVAFKRADGQKQCPTTISSRKLDYSSSEVPIIPIFKLLNSKQSSLFTNNNREQFLMLTTTFGDIVHKSEAKLAEKVFKISGYKIQQLKPGEEVLIPDRTTEFTIGSNNPSDVRIYILLDYSGKYSPDK